MRIGIDGRWFFRGNPSGRVVVRHLLEEMILHHPEHDYFVFLSRRDGDLTFPFPGRAVNLLYLPGANGLLSNCLFLPWRARKLKLDACLSFYFSPPVGHFKKIAWINDVIFLEFPEYFTWRERLYFRPLRLLSRRADRICTLSRSEKERMARLGFAPAEKIVPVALGVAAAYAPAAQHDPRKLVEVKARYGLPDRFLLYVGRLNERKNILHLLEALRALKNNDIRLVLAGDADWKMFDLNGKIGELGLGERVMLLGRIPDADLPGLYALAAVFCYLSYAEGFGLPPLEAMASGVPVVVSACDSLPEVCGPAGTYVDPDQPAGIARAIDTLMSDPRLREEKMALGLEQARSFTWKQSAETLLGVFHDMLSQ